MKVLIKLGSFLADRERKYNSTFNMVINENQLTVDVLFWVMDLLINLVSFRVVLKHPIPITNMFFWLTE